ncbi:MAG: MFS transporter [Bacteroidales bacterium]|nr:MFS transporter [Bacteroidales bacterium]
MEQIKKLLKDSAKARWTALMIVSFVMFAAYLASDVYSPLKTLLEEDNAWTSTEYGYFGAAQSVFNVFLGMLIFSGLLLDKKGIRLTGNLGCILMVAGFALKYYAVTSIPSDAGNVSFLSMTMKKQVLWASLGFAVFGTGCEMAGISISKAIVKWFSGKELALAMAVQLSIARLGSGVALIFSPMISERLHNVTTTVGIGLVFLIIGMLGFFVYCLQDRKLDRQLKQQRLEEGKEEEASFSLKDVKSIISNPGFWLISLLCLIFYASVSPFFKFTSDLMVNKFNDVTPFYSGIFPSLIPFGCILFSPLFGAVYDKYGKGTLLMIIGALAITVVHVVFGLPGIHSIWIAVALLLLLGLGYAMLPAALWPSLAKIMPQKQYGTSIALAFFIQNIGLMLVPMAIGWVLDKFCLLGTFTGGTVSYPDNRKYDYTLPQIIFAGMGVIAIILAFALRRLDRKKHYGLDEGKKKRD